MSSTALRCVLFDLATIVFVKKKTLYRSNVRFLYIRGMEEMRLYDKEGNRLYLTPEERKQFLEHVKKERIKYRTFAETLTYTGCRISEALEITPSRINIDQEEIVLRSLKKRKDDVFRSVPVPPELINTLVLAFDLRSKQKSKKNVASQPLWSWNRKHAYEIIKKLMINAGIPEGKHRMPKGLRHAFGINAIIKKVPESTLQKWMGHSDTKTTAIYTNVVGPEEKVLARRTWE